MRHLRLAAALLAAATTALPAYAAITFTGSLSVAGATTDLSGQSSVEGGNRLSFGSDLVYDAGSDLFYGITDRGPGGGLLDYAPRLNIFKLVTDSATNAIDANGFQLQQTILFRDAGGEPYSGYNPTLTPGGDRSTLGRSFDPEGFARLPNGNFLVSDEYGPSVYEFDQQGYLVREFETPANLIPRRADNSIDYAGDRSVVVTGRQDNRGFEGITVSTDGTKAYAIMQDPLVNEGAQDDGRRSRNLRIVEYDIATGSADRQFIYQVEDRATINDRTPGGGSADFSATNQGRSIGASSITALADGSFLVIERDNRGLGVDDPIGANPIGTKRVYRIFMNGATDVSEISLAGSNSLPAGVFPVQKTLYLDIQAALGFDPVEKLEGLAFGKVLDDGSLSLFIVSDNDFSVTQTGVFGNQSDVCTTGEGGVSVQVMIISPCTTGSLIPTMVYGFRVTGADALVAVPEPATWAMMIGGFGLVGAAMRRRRMLATA